MQEILDLMKGRLDKNYFEKFTYAFNAGKRIRPKLMKDVCLFLQKDFRPLLTSAAAIEIMHCASLVHDDIVDKSSQRRGNTTFFRAFGTNSAVLFGDLFAVMATEIFAEEYSKEIYLEFIKTFKSMIEGQIMEIEEKVNDIDSYFSYAEKKTSSLFVLAAKIPMMYYGIKDEGVINFAKDFGIAFQIANDLSGKGKEMSVLDFMGRRQAIEFAEAKIRSLKETDIGKISASTEIFNELSRMA